MRGPGLTFYDAASRFVTSRLQNRGGSGGRRGLFLAGSRIGRNAWQTGASAAAVQFHRHVFKSPRQQGPCDTLSPEPLVSKDIAHQKAYVDAWAAGIDPPAAFDADRAGFHLRPLRARGITVGKRRVAAAEIGVALPKRALREAIRHGDRVCKLERFPERFGFAKDRHRLRVAQMRVNI